MANQQTILNTPAIRNLDWENTPEAERLRIEAAAIRPIVRLPIIHILEALYDHAPAEMQAEAWSAAIATGDRLTIALLRYIGGHYEAKLRLRVAVDALP